MGRFQRGCLRIEDRKSGPTWVLRHYVTRESDGKRVEHKVPIGLVRELRTESAAWAEVEHQRLLQQINEPNSRGRITFSDISLPLHQERTAQRAPSTAYLHRHIIHDFLIPRWGKQHRSRHQAARRRELVEGSPRRIRATQSELRQRFVQVMACVYKHAQRHGLIPRTEDANPMKWVRCKTTSDYEAIILTPEQAFRLVENFPPLERTLTLLAAATGLRISECLGLQWQDLDFEHEQIHVRRTWLGGQIGETKTRASKQPVAMGALLADIMREWQNETSHSKPQRLGLSITEAAWPKSAHWFHHGAGLSSSGGGKAGILAPEDRRRFGFHNLRHSLASYLVTQTKTDVKTVQSMLRHADVGTTLGLYTHAINKDKLVAQNQVMEAMRKPRQAELRMRNYEMRFCIAAPDENRKSPTSVAVITRHPVELKRSRSM